MLFSNQIYSYSYLVDICKPIIYSYMYSVLFFNRIYSYLYLTDIFKQNIFVFGFIFEPNIFVFVFGFYFWTKYIRICIRLIFLNRIYSYSYSGFYFWTKYIRIRLMFLNRIYSYSFFIFEPNIFVFIFFIYGTE